MNDSPDDKPPEAAVNGEAVATGPPPGEVSQAPGPTEANVELPDYAQRRNSLVFLLNTSISYLVAPVFYIGVLHAAIIKSLGSSDFNANLPEAVYYFTLPLPVLIAWFWPSTRYLRPFLVTSYVLKGLGGIAAAALFFFAPPAWLVAGIVIHAGIIGVTNGVTNMCLWELIGRGMTPARRAWTLGITFGVGPVFAVLGSCVSQLVLAGNFLNFQVERIEKPWCYVWLFAFTFPAMALSTFFAYLAYLPRESAAPTVTIKEVLQGLRQYFMHPIILLALCGFLLTLAGGNALFANLTLFVSQQIPGAVPEEYAGEMLALRFGFKSLFGFALGWMLAKSHPKIPALATTVISLGGVVWALLVPGKLYLFSFCLLGAGELFYIYYLNYIVGCSAPSRIRENTAYTNLISSGIGFMPMIYGGVSDAYGLRSSFFVALGILLAATFIITVFLPRRPAPKDIA